MVVEFLPGLARGTVPAPPSKSVAHRCLIAAALAKGKSRILGVDYSQDILATIDCLRSLGVKVECEGSVVTVERTGTLEPKEPLLCRESGSTLRFMIPLCWLSGQKTRLQGSKRLMERPQSVYEQLSREKGFAFERAETEIFLQGSLQSGEYTVDGGISSQFITGLIFALITLEGDSRIHLSGKVESRSYIDLTLQALADFGFSVSWETNDTLLIPGGQSGTPRELAVEGDYSNAAFLDALNLVGGDVTVTGLSIESLQGDRIYQQYFQKLQQGCPTLSLADCPDLGPILFAMAAALNGATFTDTARLKIKESDRGAAMAEELKKCGVTLILEENRVFVPGGQLKVSSDALNGHNDHRIVMAMAILCSRLGGKINGAEAVAKSMPNFFKSLRKLGLEVKEYETE